MLEEPAMQLQADAGSQKLAAQRRHPVLAQLEADPDMLAKRVLRATKQHQDVDCFRNQIVGICLVGVIARLSLHGVDERFH